MDTRFSSAVHALIMIAGADKPLSSVEIANSVGTNASYIRKLTGLLKKHNIIESRQGKSGFSLLVEPEKLTLYQIYRAVSDDSQIHVFDLHQNPNDECIVGRHIRPVLTDVFREIEEKAKQEMMDTTLADCMGKMRQKIKKEQQNESCNIDKL